MHAVNDKGYPDHDLQGLLLNEDFQQWVTTPNEALNTYWAQWQQQHPAKVPLVTEAAALIRGIRFPEQALESGETAALWEQITATNITYRPLRWYQRTLVRAAILIGVLLLASILWLTRTTQHEVLTAFGATQTLTLPDGTVVTLNANSGLRYAGNWKEGQPREVWLNGEAYFNVTHQEKNGTAVPFLVHTRVVQVEVLGTTFSVKDRRNKTEVVLNTGRVRLRTSGADSGLIMLPGNKVTWHFNTQQLQQSETDTIIAAGWRNNQVVLEETSIQEIAEMLEDNYGKKVIIKDSALANRRIDGRMTVNNANDLLNMLQQVLGIKIEQKDQEILFY